MATKSNQAAVDKTIAAALGEATTQAVPAASKPELVNNLRTTWRKSAEHKAAQIKRFVSALGAVLVAQVVSDVTVGKNPLTHFTDLRTAWYYLLPLVWVAWRQLHPAMTASQIDSAPGATIVPAQVGATSDDLTVAADDQTDTPPEGDAAP